MGFLDSLKKFFNSDEKNTEQSAAAVQSAENVSPTTASEPENKTPSEILASGNTPAKPSALREHTTFGGENCDEYKMTFMLSGDFIEFNSHCELDPSFQYEPDSDIEFTGYKDNHPQLFFGPCDEIYEAVDEYLEGGTPSCREFRKIDNGTFLFSGKFDYYGTILYAYAFACDSAWDHQLVGVNYNPDVEGTPLEKKLMAALDEAAKTYKEAVVSE